jgi:predicted transcriptional regulator
MKIHPKKSATFGILKIEHLLSFFVCETVPFMKRVEALDLLVNRAADLPAQVTADRWGAAAEAGYQPLPDVLLLEQGRLELSSEEMNVLLNLLAHWWRPEDVVFPRTSTIANRMGTSRRSVQRHISSLVKKRLLIRKRTADRRTYYSPIPLVDRLKQLAQRRLEEKKHRLQA